ncbi:hypothetical protein CFC21_055167 [Triticum aestivum]|uniref:Uncharacterized protein n=2 Tax=Triticum aestivum TaxID=4565 RepID=A0A9R1GG75_WHEAT|nr:60S ribosomal protein L22-like [Triticum aestivum]KAF7046118.1 hypothetical protein CFC21_055167 [Triticum aestivum]
MVVALGPGRFYGGGLPRPRVFPGDRVDPPAPVTDALLCWARDAHWSMGGLAAKRLRLQGRIEGNLVKLRRAASRDARASAKSARSKVRAAGHGPAPATLDDALGSDDEDSEDEAEVAAQEKALRREVVDDDEDSESGESEGEGVPLVTIAAAAKRKRVRKLSDEFDRIAAAQLEGGGKKKPAAAAPAKAPLRKKVSDAAAVPAPAAEAPAKKSLKRKAVAPAAVTAARTSPKRKAAEAPAARRTSPRSKH